MEDFEVHPRGTMSSVYEEIRLSRDLARAIAQNLESYGQVVPQDVFNAYNKLKAHYDRCIEEGTM